MIGSSQGYAMMMMDDLRVGHDLMMAGGRRVGFRTPMYEAQLSGEALIDGVAELLSPWVPACATTPRVLYVRRGPGLRVSCRALICVSRVAACSVVCAGVCVYCTRSVESLIVHRSQDSNSHGRDCGYRIDCCPGVLLTYILYGGGRKEKGLPSAAAMRPA